MCRCARTGDPPQAKGLSPDCRWRRHKTLMDSKDNAGGRATQPLARPDGRSALSLLPEGMCVPRRRFASGIRPNAPSDAFNNRFQVQAERPHFRRHLVAEGIKDARDLLLPLDLGIASGHGHPTRNAVSMLSLAGMLLASAAHAGNRSDDPEQRNPARAGAELGPRPFDRVHGMEEGGLKERLPQSAPLPQRFLDRPPRRRAAVSRAYGRILPRRCAHG